MIKAKRKPLDEIRAGLQGQKKVLLVGCGGCTSVCLAGGQKETELLADELNLWFRSDGTGSRAVPAMAERQCNADFLADVDAAAAGCDTILSLACGAGVQLLAERYPQLPVFPAVNTLFIGVDRERGVYEEKCRACGDCVLGYTGGICPVTRCAKSLFNGPCGGTNKGKCEISAEIPCAWSDIYERLKAQDRLDSILSIRPRMQWRNTIQGTIVQEPYGRWK